jgi:predicted nucleic acid-binding Zn ribbon protein
MIPRSNEPHTDRPDGYDRTMSTYIFVCPDCRQEIEVNASMREAIISGGCPVCTGAVDAADFDPA